MEKCRICKEMNNCMILIERTKNCKDELRRHYVCSECLNKILP
jgi:hypothetical protein